MDASKWTAPDDVYNSFFEAVGAPSWHGRNFNALRDSIVGGRINKIDPPYTIRVINYDSMGEGSRKMAADFVQFIKELHLSGCPVDVKTES